MHNLQKGWEMSLKSIIYKTLILINFMFLTVFAQTAGDFFHGGAQLYIDGKIRDSKELVGKGLKMFPKDPKLNALENKIKEEEQNQHNQQQDQQQAQPQQQQQQGDQDKEQQNQQEQQQDLAKKDEQQKQQGEEKQAQQIDKKKELSKEEAERILQALRSDEKENQKLRRPEQTARRPRVEKDW
jgi:Ca-activated chloride channel family protein